MFRVAHGQPGQDLASTQSMANVLGVVGRLLARCPGDSAADHAVLGAMECRLARVEPGLNRDSWLLSV
jgi:hypothetical protein